jgi:hypothetical protein
VNLGHIGAVAERPAGHHRARNDVAGDGPIRREVAGDPPERRDVEIEVPLQLVVIQVDEPLHLEPLVVVQDEDRQEGTDLGPHHGDPSPGGGGTGRR